MTINNEAPLTGVYTRYQLELFQRVQNSIVKAQLFDNEGLRLKLVLNLDTLGLDAESAKGIVSAMLDAVCDKLAEADQ